MVLQPQYCRNNIGLGCSAFARHYLRNHFCFLLLRLLRCFSSAGLPPIGYYVFNIVGCPIRISTDQFVCANPRSFSQLITSFFASESHRHPPYALILLIVLTRLCNKTETYMLSIFFYFLNLSQYVNELFSSIQYSVPVGSVLLTVNCDCLLDCGEYRSRTDDLLRARQAL